MPYAALNILMTVHYMTKPAGPYYQQEENYTPLSLFIERSSNKAALVNHLSSQI